MRVAVRRDISPAVIEKVKGAVAGHGNSLFAGAPNELAATIDAVRRTCPGSAANAAFIDCTLAALGQGVRPDELCQIGLANACEIVASSNQRSIEEHYQRKASDRAAAAIRSRLQEASQAAGFSSLSKELLSSDAALAGPRLTKHPGLDDGPGLEVPR